MGGRWLEGVGRLRMTRMTGWSLSDSDIETEMVKVIQLSPQCLEELTT